MLHEQKQKNKVNKIYIYTASSNLLWVQFIMHCLLTYYLLPPDMIDGIKQAPAGLKVVPAGSVLYDDQPHCATGECVAVDPYTNEIPWTVLEPMIMRLPEHD